MRAHLILVDAQTSWPLDVARDNLIGQPPHAQIDPPGLGSRVAALVCFDGHSWRAHECGGIVRVTRRGRPLAHDAALTDGDIIECDGVRLLLEIEDEGDAHDAPDIAETTAFLVLQNGFAHRLERGAIVRIGDGPDFDLRVRLGLAGGGCVVSDVGGTWTVAPVGPAGLALVHDGVRTPVEVSATLTGGTVIELDEAAHVEFLDVATLAAAPARALDDDTEPYGVEAEAMAQRRLAPLVRKLVIEELPQGLFVWTDLGAIGVDVSDNDLCLLPEGGSVERFGASRAGMRAALDSLCAALRPRPLTDEAVARLREAIVAALRRPTGELATLVNEAEVHVADVNATPLVLSRGIVNQKFLLADAARFQACAVAIASIEGDVVTDAETPERAEQWADRLTRWRACYVAPGSAARSVNKALTDFGDDVHPRALWGLRKVRLGAPVPSLPHMDLLCALGAHPYTRADVLDARLTELVLDATEADIGEALVILDEGGIDAIRMEVETPQEVLAGLLYATDPADAERVFHRRARLGDVFAIALQNLKTPLRTETMRPPVPVPRVPGLTFLSTLAELAREGRTMEHCAALYGPRAVCGKSYLFHYNDGCQTATIEVADDGCVVQSRGPGNTKNTASRNAERILARWGRPLRLARVGQANDSLWGAAGPVLPATIEPLRTVRDLSDAYRAYVADTDDVFDLIIDWVVRVATHAREGRTWMARGRGGEGEERHILQLDAHGTLVASSEIALRETLHLGRAGVGRAGVGRRT